ncbi:YokU family protein [Bacillus lacus]|uniref:YokU family protein n=1 Tax=Metabacillus lacus TaxID=1983721 RepID=A0A7X2IZX3_9BACI|nr:YokU family protein [Metabacillus lacus]MRX72888.1 YokU family protein [Metabacillus lacus]
MIKCDWCFSPQAEQGKNTVYWELPDGSRAIEIINSPCVICRKCGMTYQEENIIEQIEEQLLLINTSLLEKSITFSELMKQPRLLKRNYFKFD